MDRFTLKPMSKDAVPAALAKAERYRLLNEPGEAESICLDILQVDPQNEDALVMLLLALTDQFPHDSSSKTAARANDLAAGLETPYDRAYYAGIIRERRAKADPAARSIRRCQRRRRMAARRDGLLRARRSGSPAAQRRCAAALERLRATVDGIASSGVGASRAGAVATRIIFLGFHCRVIKENIHALFSPVSPV